MPPFCALAGCTKGQRPRSRYCSDICRKKYARASYNKRQADGGVAARTDIDTEQATVREKMEKQEMAAELTALHRTEAKRQAYLNTIERALDAFVPSKVFPLAMSEPTTVVDWMIHLSDWHIGQRTEMSATGGLYEQTLSNVRLQVDNLLSAISGIFYESAGKQVKNIWVCVNGDVVEGDVLRPAQLRGIEFAVTKQTVEAADLLSYFLRSLAQLPGVEQILVDIQGGNHDRTTAKPGLAGLGETDFVDTYAYLIGAMLERWFADDPRIDIKTCESFFGTREFAGKRHVFEHGASIRGGGGYGGIPFYPIVRAADGYSNMVDGADFVHLAHLHTPYTLPLHRDGLIVGNGALPATTEFVQAKFKKVLRPSQTLLEFHRKWGLTSYRKLYADGNLQPAEVIWE